MIKNIYMNWKSYSPETIDFQRLEMKNIGRSFKKPPQSATKFTFGSKLDQKTGLKGGRLLILGLLKLQPVFSKVGDLIY